ncbi:MAG: BrnT family toxin [Gemmatimonadaceae bacterium]
MNEDVATALTNATGFEWDAGNASKVVTRHNVQPGECEQAFFGEPFLVSFDEKHSKAEPRWQALGRTSADRWLFLVFTLRGTLIRVLAAREMNRKERVSYDEVKARPTQDPDV